MNEGRPFAQDDDQAETTADPNTVVVAIGASGAHFEPLERFLGAVNKPSIAAFVVVLQQGTGSITISFGRLSKSSRTSSLRMPTAA